MTPPRLWHTSKVPLSIGDVVPPGRFGQGVITGGGIAKGSPSEWPPLVLFFFRECMIEQVRATRAPEAVSRLSCAFAFESHQVASICAATSSQPCYEVVSVDPGAPITRHDMEWITSMGTSGTSPIAVIQAIESYWAGLPVQIDKACWEWLSSSGLRVIGYA